MKTINEEIQKIKHLFKFKKGDRLVMENTEMCEKVDDQSPSYVPPLCSELDGVKKLVPIFEEYGLYRATLSNGCPINCAKTKKDQENYNKNKNKFYEKETLLPNEVNAGEIQKYLVDKGYLPRYRTENGVKKDNIDWDFGDTSAKAFGDFIEDKLGIDVGIQTLQDLQNYLDLLGFNTGSLGFGEKVYDAIKWVIDFTENQLTNLVENIETNKIIRQIVNFFILPKLNGMSFTIEEDNLKKKKYYVKYEPKIKSLTIQGFNSKNVWVRGSLSGPLHFKYQYMSLGDPYEKKYSEAKTNFYLDLSYYFEFKEGKLCVNIKVNKCYVDTDEDLFLISVPGINDIDFYARVEHNVFEVISFIDYAIVNNYTWIGLDDLSKETGKPTYWYTERLPIDKEVKKMVCDKGYCLNMDDIIKIFRGEESISNISNLMVDMCPPAPDYSIIDSPIPDFSETIKHMMPKDLHNYLFKMSLEQQKEWRKTTKNLELLKKWISENPDTYQKIIYLNQRKSPTKLV